MNASTLNIAIEVDDKGSVKIRELGKNAKDAGEKGEKSFKGMRGQVNKLKGDTDLSLSSFAKLGAVSFAGTLAGITALSATAVSWITTSGDQAREMKNLSRLAVMNSEDFQKAAFATQQYGVDQDMLGNISKDTLEKLGEFSRTKGGGFKDFFDDVGTDIGLTADALMGLSGPDVLLAVTAAMEDANLTYEEQSFYLESIASDTTMLIPLLKDHGAALKEQTDRADELGLAISGVETDRLLEAQRSTNELTTAMGSLKTHIAAGLAPAFTDVAGKILDGMTEGAGGVDNLAVTISEKLLVALGYGVETLRFFHNGWLGIKLVGTVAIDAIAQSVEWLYGGLRLLFKPLDMAMEGLVKLGAIDVNPFDSIEESLETFSSSSRDVTNSVISDIDKNNAAYDRAKTTLEGYTESIRISGDEARKAAENQVDGQGDIAQAVTTTTNEVVALSEKQIDANVKAAGTITDAWLTAADERVAADQRALDAENAAIIARESLNTDLTDKIMEMTLTETEYKISSLDLEVEKMREVAGEDHELQTQITDYRKEKLDEITGKNDEATTTMGEKWLGFTQSSRDNFSSILVGGVTGDFGLMADGWDSLWGGMLSTMASTLVEMSADWVKNNSEWISSMSSTLGTMASTWASSNVGSMFEGWNIFHSGAWDLKDDEVPSILQKGEMVIPREHAATIRDNIGGIQENSTFADIAAMTGVNSSSSWNDVYSNNFSAAVGGRVAGSLPGMLSDPRGTLASLSNPSDVMSMMQSAMTSSQLTAMGFDANWSKVGGILTGMLATMALGGVVPGMGALTGLAGGYIGDLIGDVTNTRGFETTRDRLDNMDISRAVYGDVMGQINLASEFGLFDKTNLNPKTADSVDAYEAELSAFNSFADNAIAEAIAKEVEANQNAAIDSALNDFFSDIAGEDEMGPTSLDQQAFGSPNIGDSATGTNTGPNTAADGQSVGPGRDQSEADKDAHYATGGIVNRLMVPSGDDGYAALKFGEGVVREDTMKILDSQIRSGSFGNNQEVVNAIRSLEELVRQVGAKVRTDTYRMYQILDRFENDGVKLL